MASDDLPNEFDIIILGTGLTETIAAAAFSRMGLKVLHIDRNDFYGGQYGNFNLDGIEKWMAKNQELGEKSADTPDIPEKIKSLLKENERLVGLPLTTVQADNISSQFHIRERTEEEQAKAEEAKKKSRRIFPVFVQQEQQKVEPEPEESQQSVNDSSKLNIPDDDSTKSNIPDHQLSSPSSNTSDQTTGSEKCKDSEASTQGTNDSGMQGSSGAEGASAQSAIPEAVTASKDSVSGNASEAKQVKQSELPSDSCSTDKGLGDVETAGTEAGEKKEEESAAVKELTVGDVRDEWRRFCFDLSPKVLHCSGDLVELLIQSDVAKYCEFRTVSRVLTKLKGQLQQVPCSRSDVFSSKIVSLIEKRLMMKFLQFAADYESHPDEYKEYTDKPFLEFLGSKKLTANIQHFVQHAIAMVTDDATTEEGLSKTKKFLQSLGRYGNTAFLFPLYGAGELPQAFARLSAVFGGVYCLTVTASHLIADEENKCIGIVTSQGQRISCKYLIAEKSYLPSTYVYLPSTYVSTKSDRKLSRAIYITDNSICPAEDAELSLLNYVCQSDPKRPVTLFELPHSAAVCPKEYFVVHMSRVCSDMDSPEAQFQEIRDDLFSPSTTEGAASDKPRILWSMYFVQSDHSQVELTSEAMSSLLVTSGGGDPAVDMDCCVHEAREIFKTVCPDEDFLPKPPNPEDIINVDDSQAAVASGPSEFDGGEGESGDGDKEGVKEEDESKNDTKEGENDGKSAKENEGKGDGKSDTVKKVDEVEKVVKEGVEGKEEQETVEQVVETKKERKNE